MIEDSYNRIKKPENFITYFQSDSEFLEFCREGTIEDLFCMLAAFRESSLRWHCKLISDVIKEMDDRYNIFIREIAFSEYIGKRLFFAYGIEIMFTKYNLTATINYN